MFLLIIYGLTALFFSFLCSIAEAVLLSVRRPYITALVQQGKRSGKILQRLKEKIHEPLAAILTLNTVANTVGAAGVGVQATVVFGSAYLGIASGILTLLILVFSEIIPKTIGAIYWRQLAPALAFYLKYMVMILYPFVILSQYLTSMLSPKSSVTGFSREEFASMADLGHQEGQLDAHESRILQNLFRFQSTRVADIMTPRTVIFSLSETMNVADYCTRYADSPFTRIPIFTENPDEITGFVLRSDVLLAQALNDHEAMLKNFKRAIAVIPGQHTLTDLFEFLIKERSHLVLVIDDYGAIEGLVTMEDLFETLLGLEIVDEEDQVPDMQTLAHQLWQKRAKKMGLDIEKSNRPVDHNGET